MYVRSRSTGYAVPDGDFDASVHSVFQSALNLRLNGTNGLLTLLASGEGDLPQGIRLETPEDFSFVGFQLGEPAVCRERILRFEHDSLAVQLSQARRWKCDLPALQIDITNPAVSAAWILAWETLNQRQIRMGSEIIAQDLLHRDEPGRGGVSSRAAEAMRELVKSTRRYELPSTSTISSLIGLGAGLTPAGDDLLVGFVAGLWCTVRDNRERARLVSSLGKAIVDLSSRTNDISQTYLYHAVQGQVSSLLANLADSLSRGGSPEHLLDVEEKAMSVGHTSGMETVTGLLAGLAGWDGNHLLPI